MININYKKYNDVILNEIEGEISFETITEFDQILFKQFEHQPRVIALSCKNLTYIDSAGINHLFKLTKKAKLNDVELIYLDITNDINDKFVMTNLNKLCKITSFENFEADYLF